MYSTRLRSAPAAACKLSTPGALILDPRIYYILCNKRSLVRLHASFPLWWQLLLFFLYGTAARCSLPAVAHFLLQSTWRLSLGTFLFRGVSPRLVSRQGESVAEGRLECVICMSCFSNETSFCSEGRSCYVLYIAVQKTICGFHRNHKNEYKSPIINRI